MILWAKSLWFSPRGLRFCCCCLLCNSDLQPPPRQSDKKIRNPSQLAKPSYPTCRHKNAGRSYYSLRFLCPVSWGFFPGWWVSKRGLLLPLLLFYTVSSLDKMRFIKPLPPWVVHKILALGVLIYIGTGLATMALGGAFLDYGVFTPEHRSHGQHWGILAVELGVGITVAGVMISIYYVFSARTGPLRDTDW